jgi:hypothetical protein
VASVLARACAVLPAVLPRLRCRAAAAGALLVALSSATCPASSPRADCAVRSLLLPAAPPAVQSVVCACRLGCLLGPQVRAARPGLPCGRKLVAASRGDRARARRVGGAVNADREYTGVFRTGSNR